MSDIQDEFEGAIDTAPKKEHLNAPRHHEPDTVITQDGDKAEAVSTAAAPEFKHTSDPNNDFFSDDMISSYIAPHAALAGPAEPDENWLPSQKLLNGNIDSRTNSGYATPVNQQSPGSPSLRATVSEGILTSDDVVDEGLLYEVKAAAATLRNIDGGDIRGKQPELHCDTGSNDLPDTAKKQEASDMKSQGFVDDSLLYEVRAAAATLKNVDGGGGTQRQLPTSTGGHALPDVERKGEGSGLRDQGFVDDSLLYEVRAAAATLQNLDGMPKSLPGEGQKEIEDSMEVGEEEDAREDKIHKDSQTTNGIVKDNEEIATPAAASEEQMSNSKARKDPDKSIKAEGTLDTRTRPATTTSDDRGLASSSQASRPISKRESIRTSGEERDRGLLRRVRDSIKRKSRN